MIGQKDINMQCSHGCSILQHFESELDKFRKQKKVCKKRGTIGGKEGGLEGEKEAEEEREWEGCDRTEGY